MGTITFTTVAIVWIVDAGVRAYWSHKKNLSARQVLRFVPLHQRCWWHLAKQQDDTYTSQISMDVQASNISDLPIQIVKVQLLRPRAELIHADASLPMKGSPYHSPQHPVPAHGTEIAAAHLMVRGALAAQGKPIRVTIGLTDQNGEEYILRNLKITTRDRALPKPTLFEWLRNLKAIVFSPQHWIGRSTEPEASVIPWTYDAGPENISITMSILAEEKRNYAARGRERGGLGSLNVSLQSEPNFGWTAVGDVPPLLWEEGKGTRITSSNLERLLMVRSDLGADGDNLERYLLAQLQKESSFAAVAYFVFLALHRMGRTLDALKTARTFLAGDKIFAYSNLLGTLSAIISHEWQDTDPNLYPMILDVLVGDEEYDFRLKDKINLARLRAHDKATTQ